MTDTHTALLEVPFVDKDFDDLCISDTVRIDRPWGCGRTFPTFWVIFDQREEYGEEWFCARIVDGIDETCLYGREWDYTIPAISDETEV